MELAPEGLNCCCCSAPAVALTPKVFALRPTRSTGRTAFVRPQFTCPVLTLLWSGSHREIIFNGGSFLQGYTVITFHIEKW